MTVPEHAAGLSRPRETRVPCDQGGTKANRTRGSPASTGRWRVWRPQRDSNPCCRR